MTVGFSAAAVLNPQLDWLRGGSAPAAIAGNFFRLHTGDPGAAGTANGSAVTTRASATFGAASGGQIALTNTPQFTMTASETISHISVWTASTGGTFLYSIALASAKTVAATDTLTITAATVSWSPAAA